MLPAAPTLSAAPSGARSSLGLPGLYVWHPYTSRMRPVTMGPVQDSVLAQLEVQFVAIQLE